MSKGVSDEGRADESALPEPAKKVVRTVTRPFRGRPDAEMTTIGIAYFLGLVILLSRSCPSSPSSGPSRRSPAGGPASADRTTAGRRFWVASVRIR